MGFVDDFQSDIWRQRRLLPQYPPVGGVSVGDIMEKRDGVWKHLSNVGAIGFGAESTKKPSDDIELASKGMRSLKVKAKGEIPAGAFKSVLGEAEAGVKVEFQARLGYLIAATHVTESTMTNLADLVSHVRRTRRWTWDLSLLIVTETYTAKSTTIITSSTKGATAVLKAKGDLKPGGIKVADLAAGFELAGSSELNDKWVCTKSMTPLYGVKKLTLREIVFGGALGDSRQIARSRGQLSDLAVDALSIPSEAELTVEIENFDPRVDF